MTRHKRVTQADHLLRQHQNEKRKDKPKPIAEGSYVYTQHGVRTQGTLDRYTWNEVRSRYDAVVVCDDGTVSIELTWNLATTPRAIPR